MSWLLFSSLTTAAFPNHVLTGASMSKNNQLDGQQALNLDPDVVEAVARKLYFYSYPGKM